MSARRVIVVAVIVAAVLIGIIVAKVKAAPVETAPEWGRCIVLGDTTRVTLKWRSPQEYLTLASGDDAGTLIVMYGHGDLTARPIRLDGYDERSDTYHYAAEFSTIDGYFNLNADIGFWNGTGWGYWMVRPLNYVPTCTPGHAPKHVSVFLPVVHN